MDLPGQNGTSEHSRQSNWIAAAGMPQAGSTPAAKNLFRFFLAVFLNHELTSF